MVKRWDPFREIAHLSEIMSRILEEEFSERSQALTSFQADWIPAVDLIELEDRYLLYADLAGIDTSTIRVEVMDKRLILSGERPIKKVASSYKYHRLERPYGKFYRAFPLPKEVDAKKVFARLQNGVLEVVLPKAEKELPRKIPIECQTD